MLLVTQKIYYAVEQALHQSKVPYLIYTVYILQGGLVTVIACNEWLK